MITWVDPTDGKPSPRPPLAGLDTVDPVAVTSEGTTLLDSSGALITIGADRVIARSTALTQFLSGATSPAWPFPFADDNQAVLLLTRLDSQTATATLVGLSDGHRVDLGTVDRAGADPQGPGAFVSVPAGSGPPQSPRVTSGDARVELRAAGTAPVVLATASQLNRAVGWPPGTPVRLDVYPNPLGDAVAVVLNALDPHSGDVPMVILTRQGALLAALTGRAGPRSGSQPRWSPGGHQIAYPTLTTSGAALAIVTETGASEIYPAPTATTFGPCIWSPASTDVLCQGRSRGHDHWFYATSTATRLLSTPSFGHPLTWLAVLPASDA
jgi:hypothetical protein